MDASIVICTHNRAAKLQRTLRVLADMAVPREAAWELIVVDNNSTDATRSVCDSYRSTLPVAYIFEPRQGKSIALNRGIAEAQGALLVFTDDDVDVDRHWLAALLEAARRYPDASFLGGKVLPLWESEPPRWILEHLGRLHTNVHVDRGEREGCVTDFMQNGEPPFLVGANLAIRPSALSTRYRFQEDVGPQGSDRLGQGNVRGEEINLEERLLAAGHIGIYVPQAVVYHRHPPERQCERYVRKYFFGSGISNVRLSGEQVPGLYWFGAPRFYWKIFVVSAFKYLLTRPWAPSRTWLRAEIRMASSLGSICECRRRSSRR